MARSITDRGRAEEVGQDVFVRVYRGLPSFRGESRISTWIYRIVVNVLMAERRQPVTEPLEGTGEVPREFGAADRQFDEMTLRDRIEKSFRATPGNALSAAVFIFFLIERSIIEYLPDQFRCGGCVV